MDWTKSSTRRVSIRLSEGFESNGVRSPRKHLFISQPSLSTAIPPALPKVMKASINISSGDEGDNPYVVNLRSTIHSARQVCFTICHILSFVSFVNFYTVFQRLARVKQRIREAVKQHGIFDQEIIRLREQVDYRVQVVPRAYPFYLLFSLLIPAFSI